jgi:hypothetical protein
MAIRLGGTLINKMYLGNVEIKKAYLGSIVIFDNTSVLYNTIIGGQGAITTTASALETLLGISSGGVSTFDIVGTDIFAIIDVDYTLANSKFSNNLSITKFIDLDQHVTTIGTFVFRGAVNFTEFDLLGAITIGVNAFRDTAITSFVSNATSIGSGCVRLCASLTHFEAKFLTAKLGNTVANNNVFLDCPSLTTVHVATVCQTNNGGGRDGDIAYAEDTLGATITYF